MPAVPVPKCQPVQSRVVYSQQPSGAAGGMAKGFEQHVTTSSNSVQISTPTSESNSLIGALSFDNAPSSSAPWGNSVGGFASSPTMNLPMNAGWFALAQVPVPTPVLSGSTVKIEPDQGQAKRLASPDVSRSDASAGEKGAKRPKIEIPEEGFHQVTCSLKALHFRFGVTDCPHALCCSCLGFQIQADSRVHRRRRGVRVRRRVADHVNAGQQREPQGPEPAEPGRRLPGYRRRQRRGASYVLVHPHFDQLAAALLLVARADLALLSQPSTRQQRRARNGSCLSCRHAGIDRT